MLGHMASLPGIPVWGKFGDFFCAEFFNASTMVMSDLVENLNS